MGDTPDSCLVMWTFNQTRPQLFSHALQNVCLKFNKIVLPSNLLGPRLSVPSPNRQEQRAPQVPLGPHPPNPMLPRLRHYNERGKPFPDPSPALMGGFFSDFSTPRNRRAHDTEKTQKLEPFVPSWLSLHVPLTWTPLEGGPGSRFGLRPAIQVDVWN